MSRLVKGCVEIIGTMGQVDEDVYYYDLELHTAGLIIIKYILLCIC